MSAQALTLPKKLPANLRPFDVRRDLLAVADLVELCFAETLDADGRLYIRQMRQAARGPMLDLATRADLPMGGLVWEEDGRVIGNLSLIPHYYAGQRIYLIANVAVHPDHRRRGIAKALTQAALNEIERSRPHATWLQVDETNPAAVTLYEGMGFVERMRRTSWRMQPDAISMEHSTKATVRIRRASDWRQQKNWLEANYPAEVRWQLPLDLGLLQPGLLGALQRSLSDRRSKQWSAEQNGKLLGVLSWQSSSLEADRLWLVAPADREADAIAALMAYARKQLSSQRNLALNYPAGRAGEALEQAGFSAARTLIWMEYPDNKNK